MRTRDLLRLPTIDEPAMQALFAKAHSADWDIEGDVDWREPIRAADPLVDPAWTAFGKTPTFRSLPAAAQHHATRRALGRMLNILQVGESVAQDVCARIMLGVRHEEHRNHAAAQALDEARHHLAYRRFIEKMDEEVEDIDLGTEMMFDSVLAMSDPLELIATEQFFLESLAMNIFESLQAHATHPLLRRLITLITRDESRHMGFGILYLADWMRTHSLDERIAFARRWLGQILAVVGDKPGPIMLARVVQRLAEIDVDAEPLAPQMLREQRAINETELAEAAAGRNVPHLLKSARRAGLLAPEILEALALSGHPLVRGALRTAPEP